MKPQIAVAALAAFGLLAAGCGRSGSSHEQPTQSAQAVSGDFADLKGVCKPGKSSSAPTQGVTATEIKVGVFTDMGFTKNPEFVNAAKAFTSWCNAAGGINGRKLVPVIHDTSMMAVRQKMAEACRSDFALVGGGAALDGTAVKDRLDCLLPDFPGQIVMPQNQGSGLQAFAGGQYNGFSFYQGYYQWLLKDAYPGSAKAVGILNGDSPVTKPLSAEAVDAIKSLGGKVVYNDLYPVQGVTDWTPYAQSLKSKGVKGLTFYGDFVQLAKLEQVLTTLNYKLDWIDTNSNAYNPAFLKLAGPALAAQNNLADISGVAPLESASTVPAVKQAQDLFAKYANGGQLTFPALRALSSWLLFATSAETCGDNLTRSCVFKAASTQTAWTGGGLQAPANTVTSEAPKCFNVMKATPQGWQPADFKPDTDGVYRCKDVPSYKFKVDYGKPLTLADVGKTMSDVK